MSVIVPAHNAAAHLSDTLNSIVAQTYTDWEAIVVDDASTDSTFEVASSVDVRIRALRNDRNLGPAGARNRAVAEASGELVALLDADDVWLPQYLEHQVGRLDRERGVGRRVAIVGCDARLVAGGRQRSRTFLGGFRGALEPITVERMLQANVIFVSALLQRAAGEEAGWFAPELFGTEDHDLWLRVLELGYEAVINHEVLVVYRELAGSVSSNLARMAANNRLTLERALDRDRMTPSQVRTAQSQLRYHRAVEAFARAWYDRELGQAALALPTLVAVTVSHPGSWSSWLRVLAGR